MLNIAKTPDSGTMAAFVGAVLLGGGNFLAVRVSNMELAPFWGAGLRFSMAASVFVLMATAMRLDWPRGRHLALTAIYGLFSFTLSYALMYWALVRVTAGVAAVILAMVPLITALLAVAQKMERFEPRMAVGAMLALGGILVMTVGPQSLELPAAGLIAIVLAALTVSQSVILGKRVSLSHPVMTNAVGMSVGGPLLLAVSAVAGESWLIPRLPETIAVLAYLVLLGSVGLFILTLLVVRRWEASMMSYVFVLFPVVTMLGEAWLLDEPLTARGLIGAAVVMGGVWFGALARRPVTSDSEFSALTDASPEGVLSRADDPDDPVTDVDAPLTSGN
jgi:drug/metabolite transporter (DMT)-like permease